MVPRLPESRVDHRSQPDGVHPHALADIDQEVVVTFRYPVRFTRGLFDMRNTTLRDVIDADGRARLLFVIDEGVADAHPGLSDDVQRYCAAHADALELPAPPIVVPGGEAIKNHTGPVDEIRAAIDIHGVDRHSYVVAIGGGAVLDTVGYAAATAHRGVRLIRVPTTVLAQDDSAVGVKNGINAFGKKNFVGSFAPPHAVLNDFDLLLTLHDRDWRAGDLGGDEGRAAQGRAVLRLDRAPRGRPHGAARCRRWRTSSTAAPSCTWTTSPAAAIRSSSAPRARSTSATGRRTSSSSSPTTSCATARRCRSASRWTRPTATSPAAWRTRTGGRIIDLFEAVALPIWHADLATPGSGGRPAVLAGLEEFREHLGGRLTIMLLERIGSGFEVHEMDEAVLLEASDLLRRRVEGGERRLGPTHPTHPAHPGTSPLTQRELIAEYFMEHRVQVLELAAFLDRLDRAREIDADDDFRLRSIRKALAALVDGDGDRVQRVQMIFSDPRSELLDELDQKSAKGAYDPEA